MSTAVAEWRGDVTPLKHAVNKVDVNFINLIIAVNNVGGIFINMFVAVYNLQR